jgi:glycosyltransferase involved in cell wall biosynthesis
MLRSHYGWFLWHSIRPVMLKEVHKFAPDVVLAGWIHPDGECALRMAALVDVPCVMRTGGSDVLMLAQNSSRRQRICAVLERADAVICVSNHLMRAIVDLGVSSSSVYVVRNGVDRTLFVPGNRGVARKRLNLPADAAVVLWVGRMDPIKGLDVLIDACGAVIRTEPNFCLCLVGDGPLRTHLWNRVVSEGLERHVRLVGSMAQETLADWYRAADLTVLPSYSEGLPNVLVESRSCGTPFVASDVGGVSEIVDSRLDRLVPPGDARMLGEAILESLRATHDTPRDIRAHSWEEHARGMEAVLSSVIARKTQMRHRDRASRAGRSL